MLKHRFPILHEKLSVALNLLIVLFAFLMAINPELGKKPVSLMIILWVLTVDYCYLWELLRTNRTFQTIMAFVGFTTLSLFWSDDVSSGINYLRFYYKFFLVIVLIIATSLRKEFILPLISSFLAAMCLNELMSYAIFFGWADNFFGFSVHGNPKNPIPFQEHHIVYSLFIAFSIFLMLYQFFKTPYRYLKPFLLLFSVTMTINLFISIGRTGQIALIFTALLIAIIYYRKNIKFIVGTLLLLSMTYMLAYQNSEIFHARVDKAVEDCSRIVNQSNYYSSWGNRVFAFHVVPHILADTSYFVGTGIGDLGAMVDKHYQSNGWPGNASVYGIGILHNSFLNIAASTGFVGLGIFIYLLYLLFAHTYRDAYISYLRYVLLGMLIASSFSSEFFVWHGLAYFFGLGFALLVVQQKYEEKTGEGTEPDSFQSVKSVAS